MKKLKVKSQNNNLSCGIIQITTKAKRPKEIPFKISVWKVHCDIPGGCCCILLKSVIAETKQREGSPGLLVVKEEEEKERIG